MLFTTALLKIGTQPILIAPIIHRDELEIVHAITVVQ